MNDEMNISEMLAEQLDRLFGDTVNRDLFIDVEAGTAATALWQALEALGISGALASETAGGAGLTWAETEPSLKAIGRHGAPVAIVETLLAQWALAVAGIAAPEGAIGISTAIQQMDADNRISGVDHSVSWAEQCNHLVVVAQRGTAHFLALVATDNCKLTPNQTIARDPQSSITLEAVSPVAIAPCEQLGSHGLLPYLAVIRSVQMGGALEQLLALCVEYGNTREQFGRPIGKFQAIQHAIAELAAETAAAQAAGLFACRQIDSGNALNGAMIAKTRAGQAAGRGAEIAHQVFGAIGFTDEHSLHYLTRRLWQWRSEAGSEFWWAEQLGEQVIAAGGSALWPSISQ